MCIIVALFYVFTHKCSPSFTFFLFFCFLRVFPVYTNQLTEDHMDGERGFCLLLFWFCFSLSSLLSIMVKNISSAGTYRTYERKKRMNEILLLNVFICLFIFNKHKIFCENDDFFMVAVRTAQFPVFCVIALHWISLSYMHFIILSGAVKSVQCPNNN